VSGPIALDQPFGISDVPSIDSRNLPGFERLKSARRDAAANPEDRAASREVVELAADALTQSADLQLAVWLCESLARTDGFSGTAAGLRTVRRLLDERWEHLHPLPDGDTDRWERRRLLLEWLDEHVGPVVSAIPITAPPTAFSLLHYEVTQRSADERRALVESGWPSSDQFAAALNGSPTALLEDLLAQVAVCDRERADLQVAIDGCFTAGDRVMLRRVGEALEGGRSLLERCLHERAPRLPAQPESSARQPVPLSADADAAWSEAMALTREGRLEGLRLMQTLVAATTCGRDRFIRQLQLAELAAEAGLNALAYPHFEELTRTIERRQLEEWEDRSLLLRAWAGLVGSGETTSMAASSQDECAKARTKLESLHTRP